MQIFRSKFKQIAGAEYKVIYKIAHSAYKQLAANPRRNPHVRSRYFGKEKIFLDIFWIHLSQKKWNDRLRRLKYFNCAIDLIKNSTFSPVSIVDANDIKSVLYRFAGVSNCGGRFFVQIKHDKRSNRKWLMSIFPSKA